MSCYNSLPLAGGGSTLVFRLNLKAIAERSESLDDSLYAHSTALLPAADRHH